MHSVFVYGTLKRGGALHALLAAAEFLGPATTAPQYRLFNCGSYPGLQETECGSSIAGELYRVDPSVLRQLDIAEGVAEGLYERRHICLQPPHDCLTVEAWFYRPDASAFPDCGCCWTIP